MLNEPIQIFECEQGTPEWHQARAGVTTASVFHAVISKGRGSAPSETRRKLMYQLAAERITGEHVPTWEGNRHTERGKEMEPEVRGLYFATSPLPCTQVGFIRRGWIGCSPDTMVGGDDDGLLEIKTKLPHLQIEALEAGTLPEEHKAQVQGQLLVTGRKWCDFRSYWRGLPELRIRVYRDLEYQSTLYRELVTFEHELVQLVAKIKAMA